MSWSSLVYLASSIIASLLTLLLAGYSWRHRGTVGATSLTGIMLALAVWMVASGLRSFSTPEMFMHFFRLGFLGIATVSVFFLIFVLQRTGYEKWLSRPRIAAMFVVPLLTMVFNWAPPLQPLFVIESGLISNNSLVYWKGSVICGPWFWVQLFYTLTLEMIAFVIIIITAIRSNHLYRMQAIAIFVAAVLPLVIGILLAFQVTPYAPYLLPWSLIFSCAILAWSTFRHRLLNVAPVARDKLVNKMSNGMLVMDAQGLVVDLNPAMERLLALSAGDETVKFIGLPAVQILAPWPELVVASVDKAIEARVEVTLEAEGNRRHFDVSLVPFSIGRKTGRLLVWHDITERKQVEEELSETAEALTQAGIEKGNLRIRSRDYFATELAELQGILDAIDYGVLLLGDDLRVRSGNREFFEIWQLPESIIEGEPTLVDLFHFSRDTGLYDISDDQWDTYVTQRVDAIQQGAIAPTQLRLRDGRILNFQALVLPNGGRMLTYYDITDTAVGLISRLDVTELLEALIARAGQLLKAPHGFIYLLEPGQTEMECRVGVGILSQLVGNRRKPGEGLAGRVWQSGQPLVVKDYDTWSGGINGLQQGDMGAIMGVPLTSEGQVIGIIGLAHDRESERAFTADDVGLLGRFAQLASVALDNARLYSDTQETQRRLTDIINFLPDATLVIDTEGRVIAWNQAIEEMTGVKAKDMLGKGDYEYAVPFYGERRPILINLVLLPDEELERKYHGVERKNGKLAGEAFTPALPGGGRYMYATAAALYDSQGNVVGAIESIQDITLRKEAEAQKEKGSWRARENIVLFWKRASILSSFMIWKVK